ncbi:MAG: cupin domain-containing protein [Anaerolineae bacterium]|nr:cupin domain-containing protein [Anaerolineae bacterium]
MAEHSGQEELRGSVSELAALVDYQEGSVVSRIIMRAPTGSVTLFAFDAGQELSEHTTPYDALVHVVDGQADIVISGQSQRVEGGEIIIMPANEPHAVKAPARFKMLLTMIRA